MATVVFDADGVLWPGLLLGAEASPEPFPGVPEVLKELGKRGHRLVCCSRNDPARLDAALVATGLRGSFQVVWADWAPKTQGFRLFYDPGEPTLFVDDDPFNLAEIAATFPAVVGLAPPDDPLTLLEHPLLARAVTAEDRARVGLLREQRTREAAARAYGPDLERFLRASALRLTIHPTRVALPSPERALDLLNRTNELRTARRDYARLPAPPCELFGASLVDRFGDYGFVGVGVASTLSPGTVALHDLAVSCRTMGRGVGSALVAWWCAEAARAGATRAVGFLRVTDRNGPMRPLFEFLGFREDPGYAQNTFATAELPRRAAPIELAQGWSRALTGDLPATPAWLTVEVRG